MCTMCEHITIEFENVFSGLWTTLTSSRTPSACPTTRTWRRSPKTCAAKMAPFREVHWACKPLPQSPRVVVARKAFLLWVKFEFPSYFPTTSILVMYIYVKNQSSKEARAYFDYTYITNHSETYYYTVYLLCNKKLYLHPELNFLSKEGFNWNRHWQMEVHNFPHFWSGPKLSGSEYVILMAANGRELSRKKKALQAL